MSSDIAHSQSSRVNEGEEAFKSQIVPGSGIPKSGGGEGMKKGIDENIRLGGEGLDTCLATGSLASILPKGGALEGEIFSFADSLIGSISHDGYAVAKKNLLKLGDMSLVEGTGFKLGAALSPISSGQGQEH
jgi:hypothetical protein